MTHHLLHGPGDPAGQFHAPPHPATAHADDRADPQYDVSLSSPLLVALFYGIFVAIRLRHSDPVADEDSVPYQQLSTQAPHT